MWYESYSRETQYINLFAESPDGIEWTKPSLGLFEDFQGSLDNNIYLNRISLRSGNRVPLKVTQDHNQNVLHTPHSSFYSTESIEELQHQTAWEIRRILSGETPHNIVNPGFAQS